MLGANEAPVSRFEHLGDLDQGHVWLGFDRAQDHLAQSLNAVRALIAALRLGACRAILAPFAHKAHRARRRDPEPLRCRTPRQAAFNGLDNLIRKSSDNGFAMHAGLLPSTRVNQICQSLGIPISFNSVRFCSRPVMFGRCRYRCKVESCNRQNFGENLKREEIDNFIASVAPPKSPMSLEFSVRR